MFVGIIGKIKRWKENKIVWLVNIVKENPYSMNMAFLKTIKMKKLFVSVHGLVFP